MRRRAQTAVRASRPLAAALALLAAGTLAACDGISITRSGASSSAGQQGVPEGKVLTAMTLGPVPAWDPQRIGSREDMAFATRVFQRTLTSFAPGQNPAAQATLKPDLATDTGVPSKTLKSWTFTLRTDARFEDGSPVTCKDVKYGVSRTFATKVITGGSNYAITYLDIPKRINGTSTYAGPYDKSAAAAAGRKAFDHAVSCKGQKLTFLLSDPLSDFNEMVTLPAFGPVKASKDQGADSLYAPFSSGPYQLSGTWNAATGGTFVRNKSWTKSSDPIRSAQPDAIRYQQGIETQTAVQRVIADDDADRASLTMSSAPPALERQIANVEDLRKRSAQVRGQWVDYLAPNTTRGPFAKPEARRAFAMATNRGAYVNALGGSRAAQASFSLLGPALPAYVGRDPFGAGNAGDPAAAKALLQKSGFKLPVGIRVAYRSTPMSDKAIGALAGGWRKAGFQVQLAAIADDYFANVSAPGHLTKYDAMWANWAPDWPSGSTVLPPLFDSRINLTNQGTGRDYGGFKDPKVDAEISRIPMIADRVKREQAWGALDLRLTQQAAYIALAQPTSMFIAGSEVEGLRTSEVSGGFVDFADIAVK